jgi:hypothetical protein
MSFVWSKCAEEKAVELKAKGCSFSAIGAELGTSSNSVKHKIRRLQQNDNQDRYKHTKEKTEQASIYMPRWNDISILETHSGFGGMTDFYSNYGDVKCFDIKQERVDHINDKGCSGVIAAKGDSEKEIISLLANRQDFDVIDVDPYGLPSRYFPYVFGLIKKGVLFLTFPVMGVAQINKITIRHYQAFWGIELSDKDSYVEKIMQRLDDYAFMFKRELKLLDVQKIDRIYRFAISVEEKSLLDIVGLEVNRNTDYKEENQYEMQL